MSFEEKKLEKITIGNVKKAKIHDLNYLQYFDDYLLTCLKSHYLCFDVFHDYCFRLKNIQESLTLIRLSHFFDEI